MVQLTPALVQSFGVAKVFKENESRISSADFFRDGSLFITGADDETMHLYDAVSGTLKQKVYSRKYGVDLVRFTHQPGTVIYSSKNGWDESLRYLSLHDLTYLRYFKGHRDRVVSLAMSPVDDTFLSGGLDGAVRMWDLRTNVCQGLLRCRGSPIAAYDPEGVVFAVALSNNAEGLKLYDVRSYDQGPFASWSVPSGEMLTFSTLKFSPDGARILLGTHNGVTYMLDAFAGQPLAKFEGYRNEAGCLLDASFSPDAKYVTIGSEDGSIHVWDANTLQHQAIWSGHAGPVSVGMWNPRTTMFASACTNVAFWLPDQSLVESLEAQEQQQQQQAAATTPSVVATWTGATPSS